MREITSYASSYYSMTWLGPKGYPQQANSGRCYYTVFDGAAEVKAFSLAVSEERLVDRLPAGFVLCVTPTAEKVSAGCKPV